MFLIFYYQHNKVIMLWFKTLKYFIKLGTFFKSKWNVNQHFEVNERQKMVNENKNTWNIF